MESENFPITIEGNSWTEVVFKCPRMTWVQILRDLFSHLEPYKECLIPHYVIRAFEPTNNSMIIEFRVLRRQEDEELVKSRIKEFLKGYDYQIDPEEGDQFYPYHKWIKKRATEQHWTRERCEILSKISRFVLKIINSDTTIEDKLEWGHLFSNMMAIFEGIYVHRSPETYPKSVALRY